MAKKLEQAKKGEEAATKDGPEGDGWDDVGTPELEGWYKPEAGLVVQGKVVGRMKVNGQDGERHVVLVRLAKACKAQSPERGSKEMITLQPDQVIGVGVRHRLRDLLLCVKNELEVWFKALGEKSLAGGKSIWEFDVKSRGGAMAKPDPIPDSILDTIDAHSNDDIPF